MRLSALLCRVVFAAAIGISIPLLAQPLLTYIPGSSVKLEPVTADCNWAVLAATKTCKPTASQTITRFNIGGQDVGITFEDQGKMLFFFGDTPAPWRPWAKPQMIFDAVRDHGDGVFIYAPALNPPGPAGPTIGGNDPTTTHGTPYAPELIGRFTKVTGNTMDIYYNMSTWNPYAIVRMRSSFTIEPARRRAARH